MKNAKLKCLILAADGVDPIYLALKQATGKYGGARRGSSNQYDSATPSPRNLSQVSLQDSGYAEATGSRSHLLGSTPQLHQTSQPPTTGIKFVKKLSKVFEY